MVIGGGVGGLATAALLARAGCRVTVLEAHVYVGGCAGTFLHKGYRFDAGATLAGGFQPGGPHDLLAQQLEIEWPLRRQEPSWVVHLPQRSIALTRDLGGLLRAFPRSERFWREQRQLADAGWRLGAAGLPWPPGDARELAQLARALLRHAPRTPRYWPLAFRSVADWLRHCGLGQERELRRLLDALLLISAQTTSEHTNALWGATALDLPRQGTMQVAGGMGALAQTLATRLEQLGGEVRLRQQVTRILVERGRATGVLARRGRRGRHEHRLEADFVIANLTPWNLASLLGEAAPAGLRREIRALRPGLGAFVLHLGVEQRALPRVCADHHQVVATSEGPPGEGNSLFLSLSPHWDSARAPAGCRAVTISTHTGVGQWRALLQTNPAGYAARKEAYVERLLNNAERALPGLRGAIRLQLAGTPVTWQYYTGRHLGLVGGFPATSLLAARGPRCGLPNLRMVGDSVFPGQSTAGVVAGAMRVARDVLHQMRDLQGRSA